MKTRRDANKGQKREPMILFSVGQNTFAIAASSVDEIRDTNALRPIAKADRSGCAVRYEFSRDNRTYRVVDANLHLGILPSVMTRVLVLRGSRLAVLVGSIDRMTEVGTVHDLPRAFTGEERHWYRGLALLGPAESPEVVPVVNPLSFLAEYERKQPSRTSAPVNA